MRHDEAVAFASLAGVEVPPVVGVLCGAPGDVGAVVDTSSHLQARKDGQSQVQKFAKSH